jgi:hypothetical protein
MLFDQILGARTGTEVNEGPLKGHIDRVAASMGIRKPLSLIQQPPLAMPEVMGLQNVSMVAAQFSQTSSFGNTILPFKAGVSFHDGHPYTEAEMKSFLTREVAVLKTNHALLSNIISLVAGIAATILFLPTFPIAGWFIGSLVGGVAAQRFTAWNERRIDKLVRLHS